MMRLIRLNLVDYKEAVERYSCDIHAYVLMTNHVHILTTPKDKDAISRMMQ